MTNPATLPATGYSRPGRTMAEFLGQRMPPIFSRKPLDEEKAADDTLTEIAETIMSGEASSPDHEDEEEREEEEVG